MNQRLADLMGWRTTDNQIKANIPSGNRSQYAQTKWKFMLEAPFEISNNCCNIMKKSPMHTYTRQTGRYAITAQMASESRLRTQQWIKNGCNGFNMKRPVSNPMSFWFEQDVLLYIKLYNLEIAPVYGKIVNDDGSEFDATNYKDGGVFELSRPFLRTTGCSRTGCTFCGFGLHLEKRPNRLELISELSNPSIQDYVLKGGAFDENGLWKPTKEGLGYWFIMQWLNVHGNLKMFIPNYEKYRSEYGNELTEYYLQTINNTE